MHFRLNFIQIFYTSSIQPGVREDMLGINKIKKKKT
jgi:hypothetical protein